MRTITVITCFLFAIIGINAQSGGLGNQVMLKGKIVDVNTKKPLSVEVEFQPTTGSKFVVKSLENDGTFNQLLQLGEVYTITFKGDNVYQEETTYTPTTTSKDGYSEITHTFPVKGLAPGVVVEDLAIFKPNSTDITSSGKNALKKMKISMRFNRNSEFIFQVNADNKSLADNRMKTLKDYISNWRRLLERVELHSATNGNNLIIKVSDVKDVFK